MSGRSIVLCRSFWWVVVFNKPHKIEIQNFPFPKVYASQKNDVLTVFLSISLNKLLWKAHKQQEKREKKSGEKFDLSKKIITIIEGCPRNSRALYNGILPQCGSNNGINASKWCRSWAHLTRTVWAIDI